LVQILRFLKIVHLVPQEALIQDFPRRTFADMRKAMVLSGLKNRTFSENDEPHDAVAIGCGLSVSTPSWTSVGGTTRIHRRRLQMVDNASACNNATNFFCWMSCLSIPDVDMAAEKIQDGFSLYCLDPATLDSTSHNVSAAQSECNSRGIIGGAHNDACVGSWQPSVTDVPAQEVHVDMESLAAAQQQFCYGGTSMYMDGFHWMNPTCVIYLFPGWVLSSSGKVAAASIGTLLFGIALEAVIWKRRSVVQSFPAGWKRLMASTLFYGLQLTMGYMIMLVVMTYSGPLFMCVIFGLMGGHALFNARATVATKLNSVAVCGTEQPIASSETEIEHQDSANSPIVLEGFTPCCQNAL
jgi:Ctr copper transporter family